MREKVKNREGLIFFMCIGPVNPWEKPAQLLLLVLFMLLVFMFYRVFRKKYPSIGGMTIAAELFLSLVLIVIFFTGSFC